jgi:alanyl-tRNA synthetase
MDSEIVAIVLDSASVQVVSQGHEAFIITSKTPFYSESGGQVGDVGTISNSNVIDTQTIDGLVAHKCILNEELTVGGKVTMQVDANRRLACSRNHTATHVLQAILRKALGCHVAQKGSLVTPERLRFDFIHDNAISKSEVEEIESMAREAIDSAMNVETKAMAIEEAKASGATALFGEKYPDVVRVVSIGGEFSKEFCGGTHVNNTGQIGVFKIISASSIGSGIKRIEAVTSHALAAFLEKRIALDAEKIISQAATIKNLEKQILETRTIEGAEGIRIESKEEGDVTFKYAMSKDVDRRVILRIVDDHKNFEEPLCLMLANESSKSGKVAISIFFSDELARTEGAEGIIAKLNEAIGERKIELAAKQKLIQLGGLSAEQAKAMFARFLMETTGTAPFSA